MQNINKRSNPKLVITVPVGMEYYRPLYFKLKEIFGKQVQFLIQMRRAKFEADIESIMDNLKEKQTYASGVDITGSLAASFLNWDLGTADKLKIQELVDKEVPNPTKPLKDIDQAERAATKKRLLKQRQELSKKLTEQVALEKKGYIISRYVNSFKALVNKWKGPMTLRIHWLESKRKNFNHPSDQVIIALLENIHKWRLGGRAKAEIVAGRRMLRTKNTNSILQSVISIKLLY